MKFNSVQRVILMLAAIALVALFLYPPWCLLHSNSGKRVESIGHHFSLQPLTSPGDRPYLSPVIDVGLLTQETTAVVIVTIVLGLAGHGVAKFPWPVKLHRITAGTPIIRLTKGQALVCTAATIIILLMFAFPPWINGNPESQNRATFLGYGPIWNPPTGGVSARAVYNRLKQEESTAENMALILSVLTRDQKIRLIEKLLERQQLSDSAAPTLKDRYLQAKAALQPPTAPIRPVPLTSLIALQAGMTLALAGATLVYLRPRHVSPIS